MKESGTWARPGEWTEEERLFWDRVFFTSYERLADASIAARDADEGLQKRRSAGGAPAPTTARIEVHVHGGGPAEAGFVAALKAALEDVARAAGEQSRGF